MNNMLSKLGKKTVAGIVLAGVTLMVGLGVVSNFTDSEQKAANEAALSRFGENAFNKFGGSSTSRAALERQMSATQEGYSARFLKGKSDGTDPSDAYSSDGAYEEGVRADEGFVYGHEGGTSTAYNQNRNSAYGANSETYQPFGSTYEQGAGGFGGDNSYSSAQSAGYGEQKFQDIQAAALSGKGGKGSRVANNQAVRPATQVNRLAASSGGSAFGSSGGAGGARSGGSSSFGVGSSMGGDNTTRALPQTDTRSASGEVEAFKFGRAGSMGGFNVSIGGGSAGEGKGSGGRGAINDAIQANAYSTKAVASQQSEGAKSLASAVFDGADTETIGNTIESGATIGKVASSLGGGSNGNNNLPKAPNLNNVFNDIENQMETLADLNKQIKKKYSWTLVWTILLGLLAFSCTILCAAGGWPVFLPALIGVIAWMYNMIDNRIGLVNPAENSVIGMIQQMGDKDRFGLINAGIDIEARIAQANWFGGTMKIFGGILGATGIVTGLTYILAQSGKLDRLFKGLKNDDFNDKDGEFAEYEKNDLDWLSNMVSGVKENAKGIFWKIIRAIKK